MIKEIVTFNNMLTPKILTFLYWLSLLSVAVSGLIAIFAGKVVTGLMGLVFGLIFVRVAFEMIMIAFKNNEYLKKISEKGED